MAKEPDPPTDDIGPEPIAFVTRPLTTGDGWRLKFREAGFERIDKLEGEAETWQLTKDNVKTTAVRDGDNWRFQTDMLCGVMVLDDPEGILEKCAIVGKFAPEYHGVLWRALEWHAEQTWPVEDDLYTFCAEVVRTAIPPDGTTISEDYAAGYGYMGVSLRHNGPPAILGDDWLIDGVSYTVITAEADNLVEFDRPLEKAIERGASVLISNPKSPGVPPPSIPEDWQEQWQERNENQNEG